MLEIDSPEGQARMVELWAASPVEIRSHGLRGYMHLYVEGECACGPRPLVWPPTPVAGDWSRLTCPTCTFLWCVGAGVYRAAKISSELGAEEPAP